MARASACASVVLPTPGTPSISRCPRASTDTIARRTTSSLPRITLRSAASRRTAREAVDVMVAFCSDILANLTMRRAEVFGYRSTCKLSTLSRTLIGGRRRLLHHLLSGGCFSKLQLENHVIPSAFARDLTSDKTKCAAIEDQIPVDC